MADEKSMNEGMDWDDDIIDDGNGAVVILEEGDYNFTVSSFERGRFPGSAKLPACNKASLTLEVQTKEGTAKIFTDLILAKSLEWKLSSFFRCIGQKKHGERLKMNWDKVVGSMGRAHFKPRDYTDKNGTSKQANDVAYFIDYDEKNFSADGWMDSADDDDEMIPFD